MNDKRQLLAVMFTDIQGYSARMGADEATTVRVVREHRVIVRDALAEHAGREIRTVGDAFLVLFESAVEAVRCAIAIQQRLEARNRALPEREQVWVRIGLHAGEVVIGHEGELYGEAVNIAARVEPLAPGGGICVTEPVYEQVRRQIDHPFEPLGVVPLKNIERPPALHVLRIAARAPEKAAPKRSRRGPLAALAALALLLGGGGAWWYGTRPEPGVVASEVPAAQTAYDEALETFSRGDGWRAFQMAKLAAEKDPGSPRIQLLMAVVAGGSAEGTLALERAVELVKGRSDATAQLVRLVDESQRERGANTGMHLASELGPKWDAWAAESPDDVFGAFLRASNYPVHGGETDFHATDPDRLHLDGVELQKFVAAHPRWAVARAILGDILGSKRLDQAIAMHREGLEACPSCTILHVVLANCLIAQGRYDEAQKELLTARERDPAQMGVSAGLAYASLLTGDDATRRALVAELDDDRPLPERIGFTNGHALQLLMVGRVAEGLQLMQSFEELATEFGDHDIVPRAYEGASSILGDMGEIEATRKLISKTEATLSAPEVSPITRNVVNVFLFRDRGAIAWQERDAATLTALAERLGKLPPERTEGLDPAPVRFDLEVRAAVLGGKPPLEAGASNLQFCGNHTERARLYEVAGDPKILDELKRAADPLVCVGELHYRFSAQLQLAERALAAGDREEAERWAAEARALWRQPDPELGWSKRLTAVEGAISTGGAGR